MSTTRFTTCGPRRCSAQLEYVDADSVFVPLRQTGAPRLVLGRWLYANQQPPSVRRFPPGVVLGAQCNVCIDDFGEDNSTNFVLGSHTSRTPPPLHFNAKEDEHFAPYAPGVVDQVECPGGSLIMCESGVSVLLAKRGSICAALWR
jgi:hypothetical protein